MALDTLLELRSAQAKMPWDWGFGVDYNLGATQGNIQAALNTFSGVEPNAPADAEEVIGCPKYGTFKYGTKKYCAPVGLRYYRTVFREANLNWLVDWNLQSPDGTIWTPTLLIPGEELETNLQFDWNLQSPDGTIWTPVLSLGGTVLSFVSGLGQPTTVPVLTDPNSTTIWTPSIDNAGIITLTSSTGTGNEPKAALKDPLDVPFILYGTSGGTITLVQAIQFDNVALHFVPGSGAVTVTPVLLKVGDDDIVFLPSITNDGELVLTPDAWSITQYAAAILDGLCRTWVLHVDEDGNHLLGQDIQASQLRPLRYLSLDIRYRANQAGTASATNYFAISKVAANLGPRRDSEGRFYADVEFVHHKSISLDIQHTGGPFSIGHVAARVKRLKKIPRG